MLIMTAVIAVVIVAIIGAIAKWLVPRFSDSFGSDLHISYREYAIGLLLFSIVVAPLTVFVGGKLSVAQALQYKEFYNGVVTDALTYPTDCYPGSSGWSASSGHSNCRYEYRTGETYTYEVARTEYYSCTDSDGKAATCSRTVWDTYTGYIYNPYVTTEYRYGITNSLGGSYEFDVTYVALDATPYANEPIPGDIPRGAPPEWTKDRQRLDAGDPRGVAGFYTYDSPILAAKDEMLLPFSQDVDRYLVADILPEHTANIMDDPMVGFDKATAYKLSFVGVDVQDEEVWQDSLMGFNAALGSTLRGDLHMVVIDSSLVDNPDTYLNALKAYWLGDHFGRRAIAKNAIIVVVGVQNKKVTWGRATTGMPFGNGPMIQAIQMNMSGAAFTPEAVIGHPRTVITPATSKDEDDAVQVTLAESPGVLESVVLETFPFQRACMSCKDAGEGIGYDNLVAKIMPPTWQLVLMALFVVGLSMVWWYNMATWTVFEPAKVEDSPYTPRDYSDYSTDRYKKSHPRSQSTPRKGHS